VSWGAGAFAFLTFYLVSAVAVWTNVGLSIISLFLGGVEGIPSMTWVDSRSCTKYIVRRFLTLVDPSVGVRPSFAILQNGAAGLVARLAVPSLPC
jgi:hypothetical protein